MQTHKFRVVKLKSYKIVVYQYRLALHNTHCLSTEYINSFFIFEDKMN